MMNKNSFFLVLLMAAFVSITSCEKEAEKADPSATNSELKAQEIEINSVAWDKWSYFSFEKNELAGQTEIKESMEGLDWDIAFHRSDVRINGGASGDGEGAALLAEGKIGKTGWDELIEAPEDGYKADELMDIMYAMPPEYANVGASKVIAGTTAENPTWITMQGMGDYVVTNQIFVVKTAKAKYAKIWLKKYKSAEGEGGHILMKYIYQPDGSRSLK